MITKLEKKKAGTLLWWGSIANSQARETREIRVFETTDKIIQSTGLQ